MAVGRELELKLPDSQVVRDAYTQANAESQPWLFNHVVRSWLFGAKLAERRTLKPDAELVAVSVLLHDLGLARGGAPDRRFEVVGADAGRAFALSHNMGERRAETVWDSIALHTTASIAHHKGTGVACCQHGIACDTVLAAGYTGALMMCDRRGSVKGDRVPNSLCAAFPHIVGESEGATSVRSHNLEATIGGATARKAEIVQEH